MDISVFKKMFRAHPWHGVSTGSEAPQVVNAYIEIVPTDVVKYEVDKISGILCIDRPQRYSSQCPTLYGLIPQTYCGRLLGEYCSSKVGQSGIRGDGDPIDICVITERPIHHGDVLLRAKPIGGMRLIDKNEADDKIIAVLNGDPVYGHWNDIKDVPLALSERIQHYFLTYKDIPNNLSSGASPGTGTVSNPLSPTEPRIIRIADVYGAEEARETIEITRADYREKFPDIAAFSLE